MDFDHVPSRLGTHSLKWDTPEDPSVLPLWVADMDFPTAPCVQEALIRRAQHPIYGYVKVPKSYYDSAIRWHESRHGWTMESNWIMPTIGVVPAISVLIQALTKPGDRVMVQTPVYNCFFSSIRNSGCEMADAPLILRGGRYEMDFAALSREAAHPDTKLMLLCNPHNPAGRVWTRDELRRLADICMENDVFVVSDEIHCELTFAGHPYTPFGSLGADVLSRSAICLSPSKAFNTAGLQNAFIVVANPETCYLVDKRININEVCDLNPFGIAALEAAYSPEGQAWLEELVQYVEANYRFLCEYVARHIPQIRVVESEGTYLAWLDCSALSSSSTALEYALFAQEKLLLNAGDMYAPQGSPFMRVNMACPRARLAEALRRLARYAKGSKS